VKSILSTVTVQRFYIASAMYMYDKWLSDILYTYWSRRKPGYNYHAADKHDTPAIYIITLHWYRANQSCSSPSMVNADR